MLSPRLLAVSHGSPIVVVFLLRRLKRRRSCSKRSGPYRRGVWAPYSTRRQSRQVIPYSGTLRKTPLRSVNVVGA
ncbi:hypothetical protein Bpfe_030663, partial [Biomphalaria pfeifferi]